MRFCLILLASCIPVTTTTSTTSTMPPPKAATSSPPAEPTATPAGAPLWFISEASARSAPQRAVPAYPKSETEWVDARGEKPKGSYGIYFGHAFRTEAATLRNLKWGRPAIVHCSADWYLVVVASIDADAGTISLDAEQNRVCPAAIPLSNVRAIVEFKDTH